MKPANLAGLVLLSVAAIAAGVWLGGGQDAGATHSLSQAAVVSVQPATGLVELGARFPITIEIASLDTPLTAFQFDLAFDPALIRPVSVAAGDFLRAPGRNLVCPEMAHPSAGVIRYACASAGEGIGTIGDGILAKLTFIALDSGTSSLTLSALQLAGPGIPAVPIVADTQDGEVTILSPTTGGNIYLPLILRAGSSRNTVASRASHPVPTSAKQTLAPPAALSRLELAAGNSRSAQHLEDCYPTDLDCDHDVDEADLALTAGHWNCAVSDACYAPAYDLDGNQVVDAFDLAWMGNDYDTAPPVITIKAPAEGQVVGRGDLTVTGLVTDTHTIVTVTVNNVPAALSGIEYSAIVPLSPMGGNVVLDVVAADELGAKGLAGRVVGVDGDGPTIEIRAPKHRQAVYSAAPTIAISYTDFYTGVNLTSLSALIIAETGVMTDVTHDLTVNESGAWGRLSTPLGGDAIYTLTISLDDRYGNTNSANSTFYVPPDADQITPPDEPEGAGWVSGVVYDSTACNEHLTTCEGLPGASVTLAYSGGLPISGTVVTGPGGFFALPAAKTGHFWLRIQKAGYTYAQRAAVVVRERSAATNEIYLTPLDPAVTLCNEAGCSHTSSDGILEVDIPAGAIPAGQVVTTTATYLEHVEFLPSGALPEGTWETYALNLGGDPEITFTQPITVRIQNHLGFAPGTPVPVGYWNQDAMDWEHAGTGIVDPSGAWMVMTVTHFSAYDCNDPISPPGGIDDDEDDESDEDDSGDRDDDDDEDEDDPCGPGRAGCAIRLRTGALGEEIALPPVNVMGRDRAPVLIYNTERAYPVEVIDVKLTLDIGIGLEIEHIGFELYIEGQKTDSFVLSNTVQSGEAGRYRYLWDGRDAQGTPLPAGVYEYAVRFSIPYRAQYCYALDGKFGNPPDCETGATGIYVDAYTESWVRGTVELDRQSDSSLGAGWVLAGLERLYGNDAGHILISDGFGMSEFYLPGRDLRGSEAVTTTARLPAPAPDQVHAAEAAAVGEAAAGVGGTMENARDAASLSRSEIAAAGPVFGFSPLPSLANPELDQPTAGVEVGGVITQPTTWDQSGSPYVVIQDVTIQNSAVLTVEAGVEVRFQSGSGLYVHGALRAVGTPAEPITFTTNAVTPAAGQWEGLFFNADSDDALNQLGYVTVTYAGQQVHWQGQYHRTGIGVFDASPTIDHTTVRHSYGQGLKAIEATLTLNHNTFEENGWSGLYFQDSDLTLNDSTLSHNDHEGLWWYNYDAASLAPTLTGNTLSDNNQEGIEVYACIPITLTLMGNTISENGLDGLTIHLDGVAVTPTLTGNTIVSNTWNAVRIKYDRGAGLPAVSGNTAYGNGRLDGVAVEGTLAFSTTWPADYELPLGTDADLTINSGIELAVEPGAEIWLGSWSNVHVHGALRALGTPAEPITLTTYASRWGGVSYYADSSDARNLLDYVTLIHAGSDSYDAGIDVTEASPTIQHTTIQGGYGYGLHARNTNLALSDNVFEENNRSGVYADNAQVTLNNCTLRLNNDHGLEVYASGAMVTPTLTGNTIVNNAEYAIIVRYADGGGLPVLAGNTVAGNGDGDVVALRGTVGYSATWPAAYELPLLVEGDLTVQSGAELTVEPGVETSFERSAGLYVHGALWAVGTPAEPITFTASLPPYGYWDGILFDQDSVDARSRLEFVTLTYPGYATYWHSAPGTGIGVYQASPTIRHTTVRYGDGHGLWAANTSLTLDQDTFAENRGSGIFVNNTTLTLTASSVISNWDYAIQVRDLINVGLPVVTGGTIGGNYEYDGVVVDGTLRYSMTWPGDYGLPLAVGGDSYVHGLTVDSGVELTLEPGTEMLFTTSDAGLYVHGALRAIGTLAQPITFTSILDTPAPGEWEGIYFEPDSEDARSILKYAIVSYAGEWVSNWHGDTWYTGIGAYEASPTIRRTTVRQSHGYGLRVDNASLTLDQNTVAENQRSGILVVNGALTVTQSAIVDNGEFAVWVQDVGSSGLPTLTDSTITGNDGLDGVAVSGELSYTMTWPSAYNLPLLIPYSLEVNNGVEFTVEPGTEMLFGGDSGLFVHGVLRAIGTPAEPITFTANTVTPTLICWRGIFFEDDSDDARNLLEHAVVSYAGRYFSWHTSPQTGIGVHNASPTIRYSTIQQGAGDGLMVFTTGARATPILEGNTIISNTDYAIHVDYGSSGGGLPILRNNVVAGNGGLDGVAVEGEIGYPMTWPADYPLPMMVVGDLTVENGAELTVEPGVQMSFDAGSGLYVDGTLRAEGTAAAPIVFTSAQATPTPGYWDGIFLDDDSDASRLGFCEIGYGGLRGYWSGRYWYSNLALNQSNAEIYHCDIHHGSDSGVRTYNSSPVFLNNGIRDNQRGIYVTGNAVFQVNNSQIYSNTTYGLLNATGQLMDARYNWWGHASGPHHPTLNPLGLGDEVSDDVNFQFWLVEPVTDRETAINRTATDRSVLIYDLGDSTFTRHYPDGTEVHFNADGRHEYTVDRHGNRTVYSYNADGMIATVAFRPAGVPAATHIWAFAYADGRIASITDPSGQITHFVVNDHHHLNRVTYPDNLSRRFYYDARGLMTQQVGTDGQVNNYSYDSHGGIQSETYPQRAVFNPATGLVELSQEVITFIPSKTAYPFINDGPVGDPDNPAPPAPVSADLLDSVVVGSGGVHSGHTNKWGYWLDQTDRIGRTTTYERDQRNNITRVTLADGDCVEYTYDTMNNVLTKTALEAAQCGLPRDLRDAALTSVWSYTYQARYNQVKTVTDPMGNTTTFVYDYEEDAGDAGNLIRIEYPQVEDENGTTIMPTIRYTYNAWGLLETETDARGTITRYVYTQGTPDEAYGQPGALFAAGVTPVAGLLTRVISDDGGLDATTIYREFDAGGNPMIVHGSRWDGSARAPTCSSCSGENPSAEGTVTRYTYDSWGRVLSKEDAMGIFTRYVYDTLGNLASKIEDYTADGVTGRNVETTYEYDAHGQLIRERTAADGIVRETVNTYDIDRNLSTQTDGNGNTTSYRYDAAGQLIAVTDPLSHTTTFSYTLDGELDRITMPGGAVHRTVNDAHGRPIQEIADEGGLNLVSSYAYDLNSNLLREAAPDGGLYCYTYDALNRVTSETRDCGGLDLTIQYAYDAAGNLARITDERGAVTLNSFDALGRLVSARRDAEGMDLETINSYDQAGNLLSVTDERGVVTSYEYDALNRVVAMHQDATGLDLIASYSYDRLGRQRTVTGPNGVVQLTEHNAFGRLSHTVEDLGGLEAETRYGYDNNLNLTEIADANGSTTRYSHDARNQRTQILYADGSTVDYGYHPDGMLAWRTDQAGDRVDYDYDGANQLRSKTYPDGSVQSLTFDQAGRPTSFQQTMSGHTTQMSFVYDLLGDVISTTQEIDGLSWSTAYAPDHVAGVMTTITPHGAQVVDTLDALGRLSQVQVDGVPVASYTYDDAAGTTTLTHANGIVTQIETDSLGRITRVASPVAEYRYGYDPAGMRIYRQSWHESGRPAQVYRYDNLGQLTQVWYGADATDPALITHYDQLVQYTLDRVGNRLEVQSDGVVQSYLPNDGERLTDPMNRYEQVDGRGYTYDARGNLLNDGINSYSYDFEDRQTGVSGPGGTAEYVYDALGQRVARIVNGVATYYVYDLDYQVIEERDADGLLVAHSIYGSGMDDALVMERGSASYVYHRDGLGSITEVTDGAGTLVERVTYDVYGAPSFFDGTGNPLTGSAVGNLVLFTGRLYDPESGNYTYRSRQYAPQSGRFQQMDPLGYVDGMNLYTYVRNDPASRTDPEGLNPNGWLCRNIGEPLGRYGRGLFCLGPGLACRNVCQYLDRLDRYDPCPEDRFDQRQCLEDCQGRMDRVPRPSYFPSWWWIIRNSYRLIFGT